MSDLLLRRSATISPCGLYRYRLERTWGDAPPLTFVMLNPSTADADIDDPTIRRCMSFARRGGFGGIVVVNLFGLRATDPKALIRADNPYGSGNFDALGTVLESRGDIVCAWGAHGQAVNTAKTFLLRAKGYRATLKCLGKTRDGSPRHPLYVRADQPLEAFP